MSEAKAYRVDLKLTCDACQTTMEIHDQPGPGPLRAYEDFAKEHAHASGFARTEEVEGR